MTVVLTEDAVAMVSLVVAATCIYLSHRTQSRIPDAMGSILVGLALAAVAWFLISWNAGKLVGRCVIGQGVITRIKRVQNFNVAIFCVISKFYNVIYNGFGSFSD